MKILFTFIIFYTPIYKVEQNEIIHILKGKFKTKIKKWEKLYLLKYFI